jgi:hypothetical protein
VQARRGVSARVLRQVPADLDATLHRRREAARGAVAACVTADAAAEAARGVADGAAAGREERPVADGGDRALRELRWGKRRADAARCPLPADRHLCICS